MRLSIGSIVRSDTSRSLVQDLGGGGDEDEVLQLRQDMLVAAKNDIDAFSGNKPAIHKLAALPRVVATLQKYATRLQYLAFH